MNFLKDYDSDQSDIETPSAQEQTSSVHEETKVVEPSTELLSKYHIKPSLKKVNQMNANKFWTTFLYIEYRTSTQWRLQLNDYLRVNSLNKWVEPLYFTSFGSPDPLHISLSGNIQFHDLNKRQLFVKNLTQSSRNMEPFNLELESIPKIFDSHLVLLVKQNDCLHKLINELQIVADKFKIPYDADNFHTNAHLSIAKIVKRIPQGTSLTPLPQLPIINCNSLKYDLDRSSMSIPFKKDAEHKFDISELF